MKKFLRFLIAGLARAAWFPAPIWPAGPKFRRPGEPR